MAALCPVQRTLRLRSAIGDLLEGRVVALQLSIFQTLIVYGSTVRAFRQRGERGYRRFRGSLAEANGRIDRVPIPSSLGIIVAFISSPPATVLTL